MRNHIPVFILSVLCLPFITAAKPLPEEAISTTEQPWALEEQFALDLTFHATREQTVVLDLESSGRGSKSNRKNTVRLLVEQDRRVSFCIPNDEPHITRIKLKRINGGTIQQSRKGDDCEPLRLSAGGYVLEIYHDGRKIMGASRKAFLHQPLKIRFLGSVSDDPVGPASNLQSANFMAFRNSNGQYFTDNTTDPQFFVIAQATTVGRSEVWRINPAGASFGVKFSFSNGNGARMKYFIPSPGNCSIQEIFTGSVSGCGDGVLGTHGVTARLTDLGAGNFSLYLSDTSCSNCAKGNIGAKNNTDLGWDVGNQGPFNYDYKGFDKSSDLVLQPGEVALFAQCNYAGPAIVFHADTPDLSIYNDAASSGLAMGDNMAASLRVGTDTVASLYTDSQYGDQTETFGVDVPCLDTTLGIDTVSSLQIDRLDAYIVSSNGCERCDLSGFDFSNEDLSGMNFAESVLSGADLSGTNLQNTNLTSTDFASVDTLFTGANFTGAQLTCTVFGQVDLTMATFGENTFATDQSCYVDLSEATLDYGTFAIEDWRYFDLSGTTMNNVPQVLSTATAPLDLSGAMLSNVGWLAGKQLDSINLGCYASQASQTTVCPPPNTSVSLERETLPGPAGPATCTAKTSPWDIMNGEYSLAWQADGNLVLYRNGQAQWATHTESSGDKLCWQGDGNLVIYSSGAAVWASITADAGHGGNGGRLLTLWSNGLLEITDPSGESIWHQGPFGSSICTTLQGTVLTEASLKNACLQNASMEGAFLSFGNLDGADMSGAQLQAVTGGKVTTLESAFMRNVNLSGANLTGVNASNVDFYSTSSGTADATDMTAPGANFSGAYLAGADFSGSNSNLQSTIWSSAMLLGANFTQADLTTNTSGGVNSGTNTTFNGAYLQGAVFGSALLDDVDFTSTYWDALGSGGSLNFLVPKQNLGFSGYWKDISLPECPPSLSYDSGNPPPMNVTDANNTCPNGLPGPCDTVWDQPLQDISLAFFKSALPPLFPQDSSVAADLQCSSSFSDPNPEDFCWITTNNPTLCSEN